MPTPGCRSCGGEISPADVSCPHCGTPRPVEDAPEVWPPPRARRTAAVAGVVIALLILGMLVWMVLERSRRTPLDEPPPVIPTEPR